MNIDISNKTQYLFDFMNNVNGILFGKKTFNQLVNNLCVGIETDLMCLKAEKRNQILSHTELTLNEIKKKNFTKKDLGKLWSIELLIIKNLEISDLIARLWLFRAKFKSQVGDDLYRDYQSTLADELSDAKLKTLLSLDYASDQQNFGVENPKTDHIPVIPSKMINAICADALNLSRQHQRLSYYKLLRLDSIYNAKRIIVNRTIWILCLMGFVIFSIYQNDQLGELKRFELPILTVFFGMIGSCMSLLQRTEKATHAPTRFTDSVIDSIDINLSMSRSYITSLVISGGIFASLIYLLTFTNLVEFGGLFPKLQLVTDVPGENGFCNKKNGIIEIFGCVKSSSTNSVLLVWGFMAGFAERLVPDTLDSFMEKAKVNNSKSK